MYTLDLDLNYLWCYYIFCYINANQFLFISEKNQIRCFMQDYIIKEQNTWHNNNIKYRKSTVLVLSLSDFHHGDCSTLENLHFSQLLAKIYDNNTPVIQMSSFATANVFQRRDSAFKNILPFYAWKQVHSNWEVNQI